VTYAGKIADRRLSHIHSHTLRTLCHRCYGSNTFCIGYHMLYTGDKTEDKYIYTVAEYLHS